MADQTARITTQVDGADSIRTIEQTRAALITLGEAGKDIAAGFTDAERASSSLDSSLKDTSDLVKRLYEDMRSMQDATGSLDGFNADLAALQAEGYDTSNALEAMNEAMARVDAEAANASYSTQQLASSTGDVGQQAQQTSQHTQDLSKSTIDLSTAAQGAAGGLQGMLSTLGSLAPEMAAVAAVGGAAAKVTSDFVIASGNEEVEIARLNAVLRTNIPNWQSYNGVIQQAIDKAQSLYFSDGDVRASLTRTIPITRSVATSLQQLNTAYDMAAVSGNSLSTAAYDLARAIESGQVRSLRAYGVVLDSSIDKSQILGEVQARLGGIAQDVSNTTAGSAARAKVAYDNLSESVGSNLLSNTQLGAGGLQTLAEELDKATAKGTFLGDAITGLANMVTEPIKHISDDIGDAGQVWSDVTASITASSQDTSDAVGQAWGVDMPFEMGDGTAQSSDIVATFIDYLSGATVAIAGEGATSGLGYGTLLPAAIQSKYPALQTAITGVKTIADIVSSLTTTGGNVGGGYGGALKDGIASAVPGIVGEVNRIITTMNGGVDAVNGILGSLGAAKRIAKAALIAAGADVANTAGDRSDRAQAAKYADADAAVAKRVADGDTSPDMEDKRAKGQAAQTQNYNDIQQNWLNLKKLRDDFIKQYGYDPSTGETIDPEKAHGGKKKKAGGKGSGGKTEAQAAQDLADAAAKYKAAVEEQKLEQNVADATDAKSAAQDKAKAVSEGYKESIEFANKALDANEKAEEKATAGIKARISAEEKALSDMQANNSAALHDLDVSIHNTTGILKELERSAGMALKPLEDGVKAAQAAMAALQSSTAAQNEIYNDQIAALEEQKYQYEAVAKTILGPLDEALAQQTERVSQLQEELSALSDEYDKKLIPLEKQLRELDQADAQDQRAKKISDYRQQIANLSAELSRTTQGTAEWYRIQGELGEAQKNLGREQTRDELTKKKESLEEQKRVAIEAKQAEIKAEQARLAEMQKARDQEAKIIQARMDAIAAQEQAIQHEQTLYNQQQHDKELAAQQDIARAQTALEAEQEHQRQRAESTRLELERLQNEREATAWTAQEAEYAQQRKLDALKNYLTDTEEPYNKEKLRLETVRDDIKAQADAQNTLNDARVKGADADLKAAKAALDLFKDNEKAAKIQQDWADAQTKYIEATTKLKDVTPAIKDIHAAQTDATTSGKAFALALTNDVGPAAQGLSTATHDSLNGVFAEWQNYYGTTGADGKIRQMLFKKDATGFHQYLEDKTALALGLAGYQGKWVQGLNNTWIAVDSNFADNKPALALLGQSMADAIADAFIKQLDSRLAHATFTVTGTVNENGGGGTGGGGGAGGSGASAYYPSNASAYGPMGASGAAGGGGSMSINSLTVVVPNATNPQEMQRALANPAFWTREIARAASHGLNNYEIQTNVSAY